MQVSIKTGIKLVPAVTKAFGINTNALLFLGRRTSFYKVAIDIFFAG